MLQFHLATAQLSTTSIHAGSHTQPVEVDTCFTGFQVKEIYKIILEYEACKSDLIIKSETIEDYTDMVLLYEKNQKALTDEAEKAKKQAKKFKNIALITTPIAIITTLILIFH